MSPTVRQFLIWLQQARVQEKSGTGAGNATDGASSTTTTLQAPVLGVSEV